MPHPKGVVDKLVSLHEAYCSSDSISVSSADWSDWTDVDVSEVAAEGGAAAAQSFHTSVSTAVTVHRPMQTPDYLPLNVGVSNI